ncbi:hypothetical protein FRC11_000418, partial [Ceratobasidium sp. 423]
ANNLVFDFARFHTHVIGSAGNVQKTHQTVDSQSPTWSYHADTYTHLLCAMLSTSLRRSSVPSKLSNSSRRAVMMQLCRAIKIPLLTNAKNKSSKSFRSADTALLFLAFKILDLFHARSESRKSSAAVTAYRCHARRTRLTSFVRNVWNEDSTATTM